MTKRIIMLCLVVFMTKMAIAQQAESKLKNARKDLAEAREELKQAKKDSIAEYQQFKKEAQEKIIANEKSIRDVSIINAAKNKQNNADCEKKIEEFESKNIALKNQINDYKADGNTNWVRFKRQFNKDMKALQKSFMESRD